MGALTLYDCLRQKTVNAGVRPTRRILEAKVSLMKSISIFAISAALALALGGPGAYAQQEIDPDHFDSPNTQPVPQPRAADRKVKGAGYHGTFSLPYTALCSGKKLAPGKYSISLRSQGNVGQATLNQKGHAIDIAAAVEREMSKQHDEVAVVENNKRGRTLSVVRVSGLDFVFDPQRWAGAPADGKPTRTDKLPLTVIAPNEVANQVPSQASPKP